MPDIVPTGEPGQVMVADANGIFQAAAGTALGGQRLVKTRVAFDTDDLVSVVVDFVGSPTDGVEVAELAEGAVVDAWVINRVNWEGTNNPTYVLSVGIGSTQPYSDSLISSASATLLEDGVGAPVPDPAGASLASPADQTTARLVNDQGPGTLRAILSALAGDAPTAGEADVYAIITEPV
jgi:hypothetical protein